MTAQRLSHVGLTVSDADRLARFYVDAFGFAVLDKGQASGEDFARLFGLRGVRAVVATLGIGDERIELQSFDEPGLAYPPDSRSDDLWFQHFAMVTDDIERAWSRARDAGGRPIGSDRPVTLPAASGGVTAIKFRDPEGHPLELLQFPAAKRPRKWAGRPAGPPVLGIDHSAIAVADTARSEAFYAGLLGLTVGARSRNVGPEQEALDGSFNAVVEVTALSTADPASPHVEFLCNRIPATGRPIAVTARPNDIAATRLVIAVADLDQVVDEAIERRLRFVSRHAVPLERGGRAALLHDPDGHLVMVTGA